MLAQLGYKGGFMNDQPVIQLFANTMPAGTCKQLKAFICKAGLRTAVPFIANRPHSTQLLGCFV